MSLKQRHGGNSLRRIIHSVGTMEVQTTMRGIVVSWTLPKRITLGFISGSSHEILHVSVCLAQNRIQKSGERGV
jgi:hypothetical protein